MGDAVSERDIKRAPNTQEEELISGKELILETLRSAKGGLNVHSLEGAVDPGIAKRAERRRLKEPTGRRRTFI